MTPLETLGQFFDPRIRLLKKTLKSGSILENYMSLEKGIAYIGNMKNKEEFTRSDLKGILTYQLKWFKPAEAEEFIKKCIKKSILNEKNNKLIINIDFSRINVGMGFEPSIDLDSEVGEKDLISKMLDHISKNSEKDYKKIVSEINQKHEELGKSLHFEVAAYLYGEENRINMNKFSEEIDY